VAWYTGRMIGRSAYEHWREIAATGGTYQAPPDLHAKGALLVPAFAAVIVLTLLAGWSNDPDLDRPGAKPGYSHGLPSETAEQGLSMEAAGQGLPGEAAGHGFPAQGGPGGPGDAASAGLPGQGSGYASGDARYGLAGGEARPTADD